MCVRESEHIYSVSSGSVYQQYNNKASVMDDWTATDSSTELAASSEKEDSGSVGSGSGKTEREWAREKRMKELLLATRGLLLHFPGSCRFNNSNSRDEDDWNTYVRTVFVKPDGGGEGGGSYLHTQSPIRCEQRGASMRGLTKS